MDAHYFTAYSYKKLLDGLPDAKLIDSERLVNWVDYNALSLILLMF